MEATAVRITIGEEIYAVCPAFCFASIEAKVKNTPYNRELWNEIETFSASFRETHWMGDIKKRIPIHATRQTYKALGKDPNRYRPSAEALCRRIVKGIELYRINTLVDLINLLSLKTGYSIGGFDADKIRGNLTLGVGKAGEKFEGIGRGLLNIEGLPVYRDEQGGIGTPTSDEERTKIDSDTSHLLMIINAYSGKQGLPEAVDYGVELLKKYAHAQEITVWDSSLNLR
ncbi:MAG: phenylalanine--tRNA ligase beta subunit-related protein [Dysgonamonadaceae bacterium]|jgi:DNA/RNA-binding domain of Phe-tRNA-synthetase-like protein|nr:phenylalanine--tRNA ligase beta subunit-related protein [Dysgonamonadaceae bacterium]